MKKMKLILNESLISNKDSDIIEDVTVQQKPDYQIIDVTVIPDEDYYPTIQSILIDLDENNKLKESDNKSLLINILSETVNQKTGYSNSLFEFESRNHTITLSLVLQESEKRGIYKVEAYTTKGIKVFESNTYKPKKLIESYLNSLANEYLIDKPLNESSRLNETGEWDDYDEDNIASKNYLTEIAKYIASKVPGGYYIEARGFDEYQGPYAYVSSDITGGELWYGETNEQFQLKTGYGWIIGDKDTLVKALSNKDYLLKLVRKTKKYIDSLNESEENILDKYKLNGDEKFRYSMLGRLQSDCKYVLGAGDGNTRHLWAVNDPKKHCAIMRALYNSFKEKPDWITLEDIDNYENKMLGLKESALNEDAIDDVRADTAMNGVAYDDYMTNFDDREGDEEIEEPVEEDLEVDSESYSPKDFLRGYDLAEELMDADIDYSEWQNLGLEEKENLVRPAIKEFLDKYKNEFDKNPKLFDLVQYNLTDNKHFDTEAKVMKDLYRGGN